jgi:hypothetical protein
MGPGCDSIESGGSPEEKSIVKFFTYFLILSALSIEKISGDSVFTSSRSREPAKKDRKRHS